MTQYDIIIIGSGLGGLECAAVLSKEGYNVCVLEKNERYGGCFQTYQRQGHLLDTGIHYVGSMEQGQVLNQYFRYLGIIDRLNVRRMDSTFDRIHYQNKAYPYAMGHEQFVEQLAEHFPRERENLVRYVGKLREVGELISIDHLERGVLAVEGMKHFGTSAAALIDEITPDSNLRRVLAGSALLYGGVREASTFYAHAMINHSYIEGAYRFVDGSMQVSLALIEQIRAHGGTVRNLSEVTRIVASDTKAEAVIVNGCERLEARYIISNVHPQRTFDLVDKSRCIKNAFLSRIRSLENTYGIFTLYLVMKPKSYPYRNYNTYLHADNDVWYRRDEYRGRVTNCMISMQATSQPAGSDYAARMAGATGSVQTPIGSAQMRTGSAAGATPGEWADVVTILSPMYMDELTPWLDTTPGQRGEAYRRFKAERAEQLLAFAAAHGIDLREHVASMYTTTPLSYRDYTATTDGSAYGVVKNHHFPQIGFISTRTKLGNLLLTGQNLNVHGALGVSLTAMLTCSEFLGQEYLAKKIAHA